VADGVKKSKATPAASMELLHSLLSAEFQRMLEEAKDTGEALGPAALSAIRQFLRDNGIEAARDSMGTLSSLVDQAPSFDENQGVG
jgi:hypothetical protein